MFFDLPTETSENRRNYRKFRKFLITKGFLMVQESVYSKLTLNQTVANAIVSSVKNNCPKEGLVQMLVVTEKQYERMTYVVGEKTSSVIDTDERMIVL